MKRSRLFLGITAGILAVAGLAASKAARFSQTLTLAYCTTAATTPKVCITTQVAQVNPGGSTPYSIAKGPVYTINANGTSGQVACGAIASKCHNRFLGAQE